MIVRVWVLLCFSLPPSLALFSNYLFSLSSRLCLLRVALGLWSLVSWGSPWNFGAFFVEQRAAQPSGYL